MHEHVDDGRKTVYADVCSRAADGFEAMARQIGCSRAALIDAIGHAFSSTDLREILFEQFPAWPVVATKAREIDSDRRARARS
jgi:hypothetical protein